jgi:hypothetical protein
MSADVRRKYRMVTAVFLSYGLRNYVLVEVYIANQIIRPLYGSEQLSDQRYFLSLPPSRSRMLPGTGKP